LLGKPPTVCGPITVAIACSDTTGGLRPRSWLHGARSPEKTTAAVRTELRCKKRYSRCKNARSQERRSSARRGFPNRICKCNAMNFRVSNSYTGCTPRGACCPAFGCVCGRCCRCAILADGEDTFSTAGLRQPLLVRNASVTRVMPIRSADSIRSPRGAYAPRSWLHSAGSPDKMAAAVRTELRCKKRHSRCTNARSQERRASARRGFSNRICKCNPMNFGVSSSYAECAPRGAYAPRSCC
jgi:hypothetical protein